MTVLFEVTHYLNSHYFHIVFLNLEGINHHAVF